MKDKENTLLIIEDSFNSFNKISIALSKYLINIQEAQSIEQALKNIETDKPDLILINFELYKVNNHEISNTLKENKISKEIPIIIICSELDKKKIENIYESGAVDYISKPLLDSEITSKVNTQLSLINQENELQENKFLIKSMFDFSDDMLILLDKDFVYRHVNKSFCEFIGKTEKELIGKTDFEIFPKKEAEEYRKNDTEVIESGKLNVREVKAPDSAGTDKWFSVAKTPIYDMQNNISGLLVSTRDITDTKKVERKLRDEESKLRSIIDSISDVIFYKDLNGNYLGCNNAFSILLNKPKKDIIGKNDIELYSADEAKEFIKSDKFINKNLTNYNCEEWLDDGYGNRIFLDTIKSPIINDDNKIIGIVGISRDLSNLKTIENEIKENEKRLATVILSLNEAVFIVDHIAEKIISVNPSGLKMFNTKKEDIIGKSCKDLICDIECKTCPIADYPQKIVNKEVELKTLNGKKFTVLKTIIPITIKDKAYTLETLTDITDRKKAELSLKESEEKYRILFEKSDDAILIIDKNRFIDCNKSVVKMLGYKNKKDLLNTHPSKLSPEFQPDGKTSFDKAEEMIKIAYKKGTNHFEWVHKRANGENFPVEVWLTAITYKNKQIIHTVWRDLTERKKVEQEIRKLTTAIEQSPAMIVITDVEGSIEYVNSQFCIVTGYNKKEVLGRKPNILKSGNTPADTYIELWETIKSGKIWHGELENKTKNGEIFWENIVISPIMNERGDITNYTAVKIDISNQKAIEKALFESEMQYKLIFDSSNDAIYVSDFQKQKFGKFITFNDIALKRLEYSGRELLQMSPDMLLPKEESDYVTDKIIILKKRKKIIYQTKHISKSGKIYDVEISTRLTKMNNKDVLLSVVRNISQSKRDEQILKKMLNETRKTKELLKTIVNATDDLIFVKDKNDKYSMVNTSYATWLNKKNIDIIGKSDIELGYLKSENQDERTSIFDLQKINNKQSKLNKYVNLYNEINFPGNTTKIFQTQRIKLKDKKGDISSVLIFAHNITQLVEAEKELTEVNNNLETIVAQRTKALQNSEKNFKDLFNKSNDSITLTEIDGHIIDVNEKMCKLLGYTKEELIQKKSVDITFGKYALNRHKIISKLDEYGYFVFETENITKSGKIIPVEVNSTYFDYFGKKIILSSARNITYRKEMQKKVFNKILETEEKERNRFAKDIHDGLGATLSAVKMYLNIVQRAESDSEKAKKMLNQAIELIDTAGKNAKEIAVNIRPHDLSHFGLKISLQNFCEKINNIGTIKVNLNTKKLNIGIEEETEILLFRVINELINNTIKYASAKNINITLYNKKNKVLLFYTDDGIGFNYNELKKNNKAGTGLDNIINRAKILGGFAVIKSKPGEGMSVKISLDV